MEPLSPISPVEEAPPVAETIAPAEPEILLTAEDVAGWRDELSARLNRYRERRKAPPPRYPSLRLPFDPIEARGSALHLPESALIPTFEPLSNHALALDGMAGDAVTDEQMAVPSEQVEETSRRRESVPHPTAKIIEFPRSAWAPPPPPPDQLAEPVGEQLRILEVPEVAPPLPALGGITIEPTERVEVEKRPGIEVPLQSAPLGRRLVAALVDGVIVAAASALFGFIFWKVTAVRPPRLQVFASSAAILCSFWAAYQYLLIVYSASTPGLRMARLELTRFDGTGTTRSTRRWRVLASYLSAASVGMGYAWVFLDEDVLCWHDRITHTYLAPRK
jgi:RDD family